jgi:hypothetical protein
MVVVVAETGLAAAVEPDALLLTTALATAAAAGFTVVFLLFAPPNTIDMLTVPLVDVTALGVAIDTGVVVEVLVPLAAEPVVLPERSEE